MVKVHCNVCEKELPDNKMNVIKVNTYKSYKQKGFFYDWESEEWAICDKCTMKLVEILSKGKEKKFNKFYEENKE